MMLKHMPVYSVHVAALLTSFVCCLLEAWQSKLARCSSMQSLINVAGTKTKT
jgi:hypothetical protein